MIKSLMFASLLIPPPQAPLYGHTGMLRFQAQVFVYSCKREVEFLTLYADGDGTVLTSNPFTTNSDGSYYYLAQPQRVKEVIYAHGKVLGTIDMCGGGEK